MKVKDCMCDSVVWISPDVSVCDCAKIMKDKHVGCIPICNDNKNVVGVITDRDIILRCTTFNTDCKCTPISDVMTTNICCCPSDVDLKEAEKLMSENKVRRLPVVEDDKIVGILTIGDLALDNNVEADRVGKTLENISSSKGNQINNS
ncbi:MAG: CBS domain-containing protein [Clostridia bacterium]|nr:CBS domain-containing protein [Clostridia bacterium]